MTKFQPKDLVRHYGGKVYEILSTPNRDHRLEACNQPFYVYKEFRKPGATRWYRRADEMEDGRFELVTE